MRGARDWPVCVAGAPSDAAPSAPGAPAPHQPSWDASKHIHSWQTARAAITSDRPTRPGTTEHMCQAPVLHATKGGMPARATANRSRPLGIGAA